MEMSFQSARDGKVTIEQVCLCESLDRSWNDYLVVTLKLRVF